MTDPPSLSRSTARKVSHSSLSRLWLHTERDSLGASCLPASPLRCPISGYHSPQDHP